MRDAAVEDVEASSLAELSAVVSFLIPLTPETKPMILREILGLMKRVAGVDSGRPFVEGSVLA